MSLFVVEGLSMAFGGIRAVDELSFAVEPGEVFTIIGPNGAGKTTCFNLINRIYNPTAGRITFDGQDITRVPPHRIAGLGIARTFQNIELFDNASVLANLLLGRHAHAHDQSNLLADMLFLPMVRRAEHEHRHRVQDVIDFLDLQHYRHNHVGSLPYGVRKVVELGRALASEPKLLLLDEPSSGLNTEETGDMAFWISDIRREFGITVLMIEHDMNLVGRVSDRVLALNYGRMIATGTTEEVRRHPEVVKAYLGE